MMDWKDVLGKAFENELSQLPENDAADAQKCDADPKEESVKIDQLTVIIDRKARKGKTATIIEGFSCDEETLKDIAKDLKMKIGTGGSTRGGEILLQGDWKARVTELLRGYGYKVKG